MGTRERGFARIGFELLVIFLGVTAAFFAEDAIERRRQRAQGQSIARALAVELRGYATFSETEILQYVDAEPNWFRAPNGRLAPLYEAHIERWREITGFMLENADLADSLVAVLAERLEITDLGPIRGFRSESGDRGGR